MKKIIALMISLLLVLSVTTLVSASSPEVNLTYKDIDGNAFLVNVEIKNNPGFSAFVIKLEYDKYAVTPTNTIKGELLASGNTVSNMEDMETDAGKKNVTTMVYYTTADDVVGDGCLYSVRFVFKDAIPLDKQLKETVISVAEPIDFSNSSLDLILVKAGTSVTVETPTTEREPEPDEYEEPIDDEPEDVIISVNGTTPEKDSVNDNDEEPEKDISHIVNSMTGKTENTDKPKEYKAEIKNIKDQNKAKYMIIYEDGTFKPDVSATRYEVIAALDNLFEITSKEFAPALKDVNDEYKEVVRKFVTAKIVAGYEDGTFKGVNTITRAEFVKLLAVAFDMKLDETAAADFTDIKGHWSEKYVKTFVSCGYTKGYKEPDGTFTFRPEGNVTRAEVVAFINRIISADAEKSEKIPSDLQNEDGSQHWAYDEIIKVVK